MGCWAHCRRKYKEALDSAPAGVDLKQTASYRLFHRPDSHPSEVYDDSPPDASGHARVLLYFRI